MKKIHIIGGGTVSHIRSHLALTAPAYGKTARAIDDFCHLAARDMNRGYSDPNDYEIELHLTKMANAGEGELETNEDVSNLLDRLIADQDTKIIFFNPALVDYKGYVKDPEVWEQNHNLTPSGKYENRLKTSEGSQELSLYPNDKLVGKIRKQRKDIFLVAFKTTCGASEDEQFLTGLHLLKNNSCNLVLANDVKTRVNMIITPEQARYEVTTDRNKALEVLVSMAMWRARGTFTRSTVLDGVSVDWNSAEVPESLRKVVNYCISKGAYKPFQGSTVGHFAVKVDKNTFLTSKRKTNFNRLVKVGLVKVVANGDDSVIAQGAKPSVGGQSQRIIFNEHPEMDCIVHFHCPMRQHTLTNIVQNNIPVRQQKYFECGSHQCGKNTSDGLAEVVPGIKAVYLDEHGPNIVFNHSVDPEQVISFIDRNFDLSESTDRVQR